MQTETQVSSVSAFRLFNPLSASLVFHTLSSIPLFFFEISRAPSLLHLHSQHACQLLSPTLCLIILPHVTVLLCLLSPLLFRFGSLALLCWCSAGNHSSAPAGGDQREKDLETAREKRKKKGHEGERESAGRGFAEEPFSSGAAAQAVPDVCAAFHVISRPLRATLTGFNSFYFPSLLFLHLFLCSSLAPLVQTACTPHMWWDVRATRGRNAHTHAQHNTPSPSLTGGIYRELKSGKEGGVTACVCVYKRRTVELFWSPAPKTSAVTRKKYSRTWLGEKQQGREDQSSHTLLFLLPAVLKKAQNKSTSHPQKHFFSFNKVLGTIVWPTEISSTVHSDHCQTSTIKYESLLVGQKEQKQQLWTIKERFYGHFF